MLNVLLWSWKHINIHFEYQLKILSCTITGEWITYVQLPVTHSGFSALWQLVEIRWGSVFWNSQQAGFSFTLFFLTSLLRMMLMLQEISSCDTAECCGKERSDDAAVRRVHACAGTRSCPDLFVCQHSNLTQSIKCVFLAERLGKRVWVKIWGGSCHRDKQCLREARPVLENSLLQPTHNSSLLPALHIGTAYWKGQPQNDSEALLSNKKAVHCYFSDSCSKFLVFKNGCTDGC